MIFKIFRYIQHLAGLQLRQVSSASVILPPHREHKVKILDVEINVCESMESEPNVPVILFLPGGFGSIEMDFKPIMHAFDRRKYKWISWDPPGYGKSRPPYKKQFISQSQGNVKAIDVDYIKELMNIFGYQKYTLLSWSGATIYALKIAADQPENVSSVISWGGFGYVGEEIIGSIKVMKKMGIEAIPKSRKSQLLAIYGEPVLREMWSDFCDELVVISKTDTYGEGGTFLNDIKNVKCPALIIHGMKDALVGFSHAKQLIQNLNNSRLYVMPNGTHNLHLKETEEFVHVVQQFVDQNLLPQG